jgi:hypothetical protein
MTLVGQFFALAVAVVDPMQPTAGPKSFVIGGDLGLPLFDKINDTLGFFLTLKTKHTLEKFLRDKARKPLTSWKNSYTSQH